MAKFKVGDKVAYYGKESAIYRQRGTVSDVSQIRGETFVTVDLDNGEEWGAPEKDWAFMNSRAANAKFKVGDYVMYKDPSGHFGELPGLVKGTKGDKLTLEVSMGRREEVSDRDAVLMTSKLNVKVGDKIKLWQVARDQTSDEFVIKKINRNDILVEGDSKSGRFTYSFPIEKIRGSRHFLFNSRACNAKFKVGDKVAYSVFGQTKTGTVVEVTEKFHSKYGNEHEGEQTYMVDFGKKPYSKTWESRMTLANARAANAKFKVGDRVHHGNVMYISKSNPDRLVGTITKWDDERGAWEVKFKDDPRPVYWSSKEMVKYNSRACNGKFKINDAVTVWRGKYKGREGRILAIDPNATDKDLAVILGHEGQTVVEVGDLSKHFKDGTNSRACNAVARNFTMGKTIANAEITPELRRAYDEWQKAKAKFMKWWNPDRRLSERPPKGADYSKYGMAFSDLFFKETGRRPPNGYGEMTLEQMLASNSQSGVRSTNAVVQKALNASCVARNGYVDVYTIAKQEWNRAYRGNEPFGVDAEIKPNGDFKIQEVAHGKVDDSDVDWNPIADKVKRALLAAGNKSAVVKVNPYGNGIVGNLGIARNACSTARNAGDRDMYEDAIRQAIVKCEAAVKYEPDADDYSDVTRLVKQAKDLLAKAYRAI